MGHIDGQAWAQLARIGAFVVLVLLVVKVRPWRWLGPFWRSGRG